MSYKLVRKIIKIEKKTNTNLFKRHMSKDKHFGTKTSTLHAKLEVTKLRKNEMFSQIDSVSNLCPELKPYLIVILGL